MIRYDLCQKVFYDIFLKDVFLLKILCQIFVRNPSAAAYDFGGVAGTI